VKKLPNQGSQMAGKLWMISMGLFLMALGSFFMWYLWAFFQKSSRMDHWVETPCVIEKSEVDDSGFNQHYGKKYALVTVYRYQFKGQEYVGQRFKRIQPVGSHFEKISKLAQETPAGQATLCFVNPDDPASAVLKKDTKGSIYSIWFPGLFALGGLGMVISALRQSR
jgi:Protein of unknown function (DUF3592)